MSRSCSLFLVAWCALAAPVQAQLPSRAIIRLLNEPIEMRDCQTPKGKTPEAATDFVVWQEGEAAAPDRRADKQAPAPKTAGAELLHRLQETIDAKDLQQPMTLKEALGIFYRAFEGKGVEMPILVDNNAFKLANPDAPDLYETQVHFPPYPRKLSLANALKIALSQVPTTNATYWVRGGVVEITTPESITLDKLKNQRVSGQFTREPLHRVIAELSEQTGITVVLDDREQEKFNLPVTLTLRNNVSVHDALRILADMAGLRLVELPTSLCITRAGSPLGEESRQGGNQPQRINELRGPLTPPTGGIP